MRKTAIIMLKISGVTVPKFSRPGGSNGICASLCTHTCRYSDWLRAGRSEDRIPVGGEIFRTCSDRPTQPPVHGYRVFPGGKERPERDADPSPPSSAVVMKGKSYTSTPPRGRTACTEPQCLYKCALYLYLLCTHIRV